MQYQQTHQSLNFNSKRNIYSIRISIFLFISCLFALNATAQIDTIDPQLVSFIVSPQTIDISFNSSSVTITVIATDNISGVGSVIPTMTLPNGNQSTGGAGLVSGTHLNGTWVKMYSIPQGTLAGTGIISSLLISDLNSNQIVLTSEDLINLGFDPTFEIINNVGQDVTPPQIISLIISPQVVDVTSSTATITLTAVVTDDFSGVSTVSPTMILPNGNSSSGGASLVAGTPLNGTWVKTFIVPLAAEPGIGIINSIALFDENGNHVTLSSASLIALGFDNNFEIINNAPNDVSPPQLVSFSVTPQIVNLTNGSKVLTITAVVTDDISGVAGVSPLMFLPNGDPYSGGASLINGTHLNGTWKKNFTIPYGTQPGTGIIGNLHLVDENANQVDIPFSTLQGMGFDPDFLVIYDPLAIDLLQFTSSVVNKQIVLSWKTVSEINNSTFEIQSSGDAKEWNTIGFEEGEGNSNEIKNYQFTDCCPKAGSNYYRLKQVDFDGNFSYSPIIHEVISLGSDTYLYPNPTEGKIEIVGAIPENIMILDDAGKFVKNVNSTDGHIDLSTLPDGTYVLSFYINNLVISHRVVKTH